MSALVGIIKVSFLKEMFIGLVLHTDIPLKKGVMCNTGTIKSVLRFMLEWFWVVRDKMRIFLNLKYYVKHSELGPYCTTFTETDESTSLKTGLVVPPEKFLY